MSPHPVVVPALSVVLVAEVATADFEKYFQMISCDRNSSSYLVVNSYFEIISHFTCTNLFAADKGKFPAAIVVEPHHSCFLDQVIQAVRISALIVWFSWLPEFDFPGRAVYPLPSGLLLNVVASQPNMRAASKTLPIPLFHVFFGGTGGNRGQVSSLLLAEVLSISPALWVVAPEVAVVAVLLPALFAGFDALVPAAVGS